MFWSQDMYLLKKLLKSPKGICYVGCGGWYFLIENENKKLAVLFCLSWEMKDNLSKLRLKERFILFYLYVEN